MRNHDALGPCRRSAGVVDRDEIRFIDLDRRKLRIMPSQCLFIINPPFCTAFQVNEHLCLGNVFPDRFHCLDMVGMCADDFGATMIDDVREILGFEPEIDRDQYRSDLRDCIVRF